MLEGRAAVPALDLPARGFNQPAVFHARRAGRFAGAAIEAQVEVPHHAFAERQAPLLHLNHLVDASSRRVHLLPQFAIGWAGVQAQAAVDALRVVVPAWRLTGAEVRDREIG